MMMKIKRFYFDGTKIDYYWCIRDNENKDNNIWVDCPRDYIPIIINALNKQLTRKENNGQA